MVGGALLRVTENAFLIGFFGGLYCLAVVGALLALDAASPRATGDPTVRRRFTNNATTRVLPRDARASDSPSDRPPRAT